MGGLLKFKQESDSRELSPFLVSMQKWSHNCNSQRCVFSSNIYEAHIKYWGPHQVLSTHRWVRCCSCHRVVQCLVMGVRRPLQHCNQCHCTSQSRELWEHRRRRPPSRLLASLETSWAISGVHFSKVRGLQAFRGRLTKEAVSLGKMQHETNDGNMWGIVWA